MSEVRADGIAVYVYRYQKDHLEFLQIQRSQETGEYQGSWQIVYGGIEPLADGETETAVQAALRELREETGLTPRHLMQVEYVETFYFRSKDYVLLMPVFAAEVSPDAEIKLNPEHTAFRWIPASEIDTHFMWRTQREALAIIIHELQHPTLARPQLEIQLESPH